jgi:acetyltransferase-like isoleucine patch superfamily enzyme
MGNKMENVYIHPSAHVSEQAYIGKGTKIWINAQIRENATVGENCVLGKDTYIDAGVVIGNGVKIQNGVSIYRGVTISDDVFIGPNTCFSNDYYPRAFNADWKVVETKIERGASIGANATIICGYILGEYCMVGAGSVVTRDIPPFKLVMGNPARQIRNVCKCGESLNGDTCSVCGFNLLEMHK